MAQVKSEALRQAQQEARAARKVASGSVREEIRALRQKEYDAEAMEQERLYLEFGGQLEEDLRYDKYLDSHDDSWALSGSEGIPYLSLKGLVIKKLWLVSSGTGYMDATESHFWRSRRKPIVRPTTLCEDEEEATTPSVRRGRRPPFMW